MFLGSYIVVYWVHSLQWLVSKFPCKGAFGDSLIPHRIEGLELSPHFLGFFRNHDVMHGCGSCLFLLPSVEIAVVFPVLISKC